jgi:hypothetical protein
MLVPLVPLLALLISALWFDFFDITIGLEFRVRDQILSHKKKTVIISVKSMTLVTEPVKICQKSKINALYYNMLYR